jgi:hypothetical protein
MCGAAACGDGPRTEDEMLTTAPTGVSQTNGTDDSAGDAGASEDGAGESTGTPEQKFDVGQGMATAGDGGDADGCDKVDFLFVIDNSGSMGDEQQNLINSFPGFINTIETELDAAQDYHLMVLDVDAWIYESCQQACDPPPECVGMMGQCNPFGGPACLIPCTSALPCALDGGFQCGVTMPEMCEDVLGAGVTHPRGSQSSNQDCAFSSGKRYMDSSEPDLTAAFQCAAQVGTGSLASTELPMEAMVQAVTPSTEAFACNEGFIRDDAILVVTFITDESDSNGDSAGTPPGWKQALVAAKNGDESAIVVLGLFGDNDQPGGICQDLADGNDGAEAAPRLREFVDSFSDHGFFGSVCAPSYDDFFMQAVGLIDTTCDEFTPPEG